MLSRSVEIWIGLVVFACSAVALFIWVPLDSETPPIYTFRRQTYIGDAFMPMVAAAGMVICSAIHIVISFLRRDRKGRENPFDTDTMRFFFIFGAVCVASLLLMFWSGAIAAAIFASNGDEPVTYRQLRGAVPWKYIGFVLGGFTMVFGITTLIEGGMKAKRAVTALLAVAALILLFDVPFDTILLPPNGDF